MKILKTKNHATTVNLASWNDPTWWLKDNHGLKVSYLLSAHIHTHAECPKLTLLHLIAGPLRVVIAWNKVKRTWTGPAYATFALSVFSFQDNLMMGRWAWAAVWLALIGWNAINVARESR